MTSKKNVYFEDYLATFSDKDRKDINEMTQEILAEIELRKIREANHLTQREVAASIGISQPAISNLEENYTEAKISTLRRYFEALKTTAYIVAETASGQRIQLPLA